MGGRPRGSLRVIAGWTPEHPASLAGLARSAQLHASTMRYHAMRLERDGGIWTARAGRERVVLPRALGRCRACRSGIAALMTGSGLLAALAVADVGQAAVPDLRRITGLSRGAIRSTVQRLVARGLVAPRRDGARTSFALSGTGIHCLDAVIAGRCDAPCHIVRPR